MIGYKATDMNGCCKGFKFEVGKTYTKKAKKCKYCKGSGMVAMGTDMFGNTIKGFKECPYCKGTGVKE